MVNRVKKSILDPTKHQQTLELEAEAKALEHTFFVTKYKNMYINPQEKIRNSWRANHDEAPDLIGNIHELKLRITDMAKPFGLNGDIELDHGYSFAHQITMFFPTYFQKQIIKSQFSLYDVFAGRNDSNEKQKNALVSLTKVDTNIFRDIST